MRRRCISTYGKKDPGLIVVGNKGLILTSANGKDFDVEQSQITLSINGIGRWYFADGINYSNNYLYGDQGIFMNKSSRWYIDNAVCNYLSHTNIYGFYGRVSSNGISQSCLYVTDEGVYRRSSSIGTQWYHKITRSCTRLKIENNYFIACSTGGYIAYAKDVDGDWTLIKTPSSSPILDIIYDGKKYFAITTNQVLQSDNIENSWTVKNQFSGNGNNTLVYNNGNYIIGNYNGYYYSSNGSDWSFIVDNGTAYTRQIIHDGNRFIAVNSAGKIQTSLDGKAWEILFQNNNFSFTGIDIIPDK